MLKKILAPIQAWILLQGKCVGCGRSLSGGRKLERKDNSHFVTCRCRRIFIFDKRKGKYRRAAFSEISNES